MNDIRYALKMGNKTAQADNVRWAVTKHEINFARCGVCWVISMVVLFLLNLNQALHARVLDPESPFQGKYLGAGYMQDHPVHKSRQFFSSVNPSPYMTYHYIRGDWSMGLRFYMNRYTLQDDHWIRGIQDSAEVPIMTISQSSDYLLRLYYPLYLGMGYSLMYLYPMEKMGFPGKKSAALEAEFGAAVGLSLYYQLAPRWFGQVKFERWRGISTTRLEGYYYSLGLAYRI